MRRLLMSRFELLSMDRITNSPSSRDGISLQNENELRMTGCNFLRSLCKNLDLYPFICFVVSVINCVQNRMSFIQRVFSSIASIVYSHINLMTAM